MTTAQKLDAKKTILLVGNTGCGKTSLVNAFVSGIFTEHYVHSKPCSHPNSDSTSGLRYENVDLASLEEGRHASPRPEENDLPEIRRTLPFGERNIEFTLRDTNGDEDEDLFNALVHDAHVVFICFAVDDVASLEDARSKWATRVGDSRASTPTVLVGCKTDLRTDPKTIKDLQTRGGQPVSEEEATVSAWEMKPRAKLYAECSAKNSDGVLDVFTAAATVAVPVRTWKGRLVDVGHRWMIWLGKWGWIMIQIYCAVIFLLFLFFSIRVR